MMKMTRRLLRDLILEVITEAAESTTTQSAGVIIIDGDRVLSLRAYENWDFPKGRVEAGESLLDAAVRETEEETTLVSGEDYTLTGDQAPSITYGTGKRVKTATYFIATRKGNKEPFLPVSDELGRPENDEWRWVPLALLDNKDSELGVVMSSRLSPVINYILKSSETQGAEGAVIQALREMSGPHGLPVTHEVPAASMESVFRDRAVRGYPGIFFTLGHLKSQQFVTGEGYMIHGYIPHRDIHANMIHPDMRFTPQDDEHESAWGVMLSEARKRREGFYGLEISTNYEWWTISQWQAVIDNTSGEVEWDGGVP
jgi:8-oxo-dGTP pyrophosphatase MutT (NUDIX family)